ncbi:MAG: hypothetical protein JXN59_19060, partial [Anaerolineae bacterium]|nr:hypothetical protein [Anaerolineae bacterium]
MADQPWNPDDEDLPPGTEDHEMPTRHVHPIEEYLDEMLAETRLSPSVPDLPPESDAVNDEAGWFAPNDAQDDDVPLFDEAALSGETVAHHVPADYDPADDDPGAYNPADYDPSDYDPAAYNPADYDPADYGPVDDAGPAYSDQGYDEPPYDAE